MLEGRSQEVLDQIDAYTAVDAHLGEVQHGHPWAKYCVSTGGSVLERV